MNSRTSRVFPEGPFRLGALILVTVFLACLCSESSRGGENHPSRLVAAPPPGMTWVVRYRFSGTPDVSPIPSSSDDSATGGPSLLREENEMSEDLRKETRHFRNAPPLTLYAWGDLLAYRDPRSKRIVVESTESQIFGHCLTTTEFAEFSWVEQKWHVGTRTVKDVLCDVYRRPWPEDSLIDLSMARLSPESQKGKDTVLAVPKRSGPEMIAVIARDTRLPVSLEDPVETRSYTFSAANSVLSLPPEFAQAIANANSTMEKRRNRYKVPQ